MGQEQLQQVLKREQESIEMMVIAYQAKAFDSIFNAANNNKRLDNFQKQQYIQTEFKNLLINMEGGQAFSPERAEQIAQRYTPLAVLDKDGAGAIIFRDATDNQNIIAVRGTDIPNNIREDIAADWGISVGILPMYQTSLIDNFIARETAPAGASVPQVWFDTELGIVASEPELGTGRATGQIKYIAAHSEGGPEAQTLGLRYGADTWTLNAPGVADFTIQRYLDQVGQTTQRPSANAASHSIHIDTTGVSIISQLHGGLEGEHVLMATEGASHRSVVALQVSRLQERLLNENPKIQDRETLIYLTKEYVLNPERGEQIIKVFNEHKGATPETATEWVDLERGRKFVSISGVKVGEQWFQDATTKMQEADKQAEKLENLQQINQREMSRLQSQPKQTIHQPVPHYAPQNSIHHRTHTHQLTPNLLSIPNPETSQHGVININTSDMSIIPQHSDKQPKKTSEDAYGGDLPMGEMHQPSRSKNANQPLYNDGKDVHDMRLDRQKSAEVPYRLRSDAAEQINPELRTHLTSATQTPELMAFPPSHNNPMLQALLQNPAFTTLSPEQQATLIAGAGGQVSNLVTPSFDAPNINNATAGSVNEFIDLPPRVASLHAQITEKFGDQIAHLSEKDQQTTIALATREAMSFYARTVDYVFVNQQGDVCISFDGDKGFSGDVNLNQVHHQDANQVLLASIDRQQNQLQELSMQRAQSQNQSPTMSI